MRQQPYMLYYTRTSPIYVPRKIPVSPIQRQRSFETSPIQRQKSFEFKPTAAKSPENKFRNTFVSNNNPEKKSPITKSPVLTSKFIGPERPTKPNTSNQNDKTILKPSKFKPSNGFQKSPGGFVKVKPDPSKKQTR